MGLSAFHGNFVLNTGTGNQAITGLGFQPKIILFYSSCKSGADGGQNDGFIMFGVASSSTARWVTQSGGPWGFGGGSANKKNWKTTRCIFASQGFGTVAEADFVSMDADGFTINISTASTAIKIFYLALGGTDLSAFVGNTTLNSSTGNQAITGVGFQPDYVGFGNTKAGTSTAEENGNNFCHGGAISSTSRFVTQQDGNNGNPTDENGSQITTKCLRYTSAAAVSFEADFVSMDTDGFTINVSTASGTPAFGYFCLKGLQVAIGTETQKTSTGTKATTGIGFLPNALFFVSRGKTNSASITADAGMEFGSASAAGTEGSASSAALDAIASNTRNQKYSNATKAISHITATAASGAPTVNGLCDVSSLDADGYTLDWTTADATAREHIHVCFAELAVASTGQPTYSRRKDQKFLRQSPALLAA